MQDLPVNDRNYISLMQLLPGANNTKLGSAGGTGPDDRRTSNTLQVNAQYPGSNNFQIDGMDNNERWIGTILVKPPIDAVQEAKVDTNVYSAEIGRTMGGVINVITKSGTNQLHGDLFEYLRNDKFDAEDWTAKAVLPYKLNQFGGSLGGPIVKDRTFYFVDYEGYRKRVGVSWIESVPTDAMRTGDFSDLYLAENRSIQIYDPVTYIPYAGNVIPSQAAAAPGQTALDPVGLALLNLYPSATSTDRHLASANYIVAKSESLDTDAFDVRLDHRVNSNGLIFGRYSFRTSGILSPPRSIPALHFG